MRKRTLLPILSILTLAAASACSSSPRSFDRQSQHDQYGPSEDPTQLIPGASTLLSDNITAADVGQTFGAADANVPYPDTYWPFTQGGTDAQWNPSGTDARTPIEKYMALFDTANVQAAKDWEANNHGPKVPGVSGWWGHCPGWTGAAMSNAPIQHAISVKNDGTGNLAACNAGDQGCVTLEIGDIDALLAEVYVDGNSSFIGARCDTKPSDIQRDSYGRIVRNGTGCKGLNAGALLIALGQQMKVNQKPLAIDAQNDFNTDQIWNQPAYRYTVYRYETVDVATAANLVAHGTRTGDKTTYEWDGLAQGFVFVDIGIQWVSEYGPNTTMVSGTQSTQETRFVAVIELDQDPSNAAANIIGGEYVDDPSVGADRLTVPPFVWVSNGPGPESLDPSVSGDDHNPYIHPSNVATLAQLGQN